jgi:hypothetical protein
MYKSKRLCTTFMGNYCDAAAGVLLLVLLAFVFSSRLYSGVSAAAQQVLLWASAFHSN